MRTKLLGWLLGVFCLMSSQVYASHIVGGEFSYVCKNNEVSLNNIRYQVRFSLYMDCITGIPQVIAGEDYGFFAVYTGDKILIDTFSVYRTTHAVIPTGFSNDCINNPPNTCLLRNVYNFTLNLPNNASGYYIVQTNCCRNPSVLNIINPGGTGASYYSYIPPRGQDNNSAVFNNIPPQIICINNPFTYTHSATDPDGDSLSYEFGPAYKALTQQNGNNIIALVTPPPYPSVDYVGAFTALNPVGGNPMLQIDPQTGVISGTPNMVGRFVVSVHCHEWRNGVIINTDIRDYQFVVTNCSKAVVADIPQYSDEFNTYVVQCKSTTVTFDNLSTGGFSYYWDFGVPNLQNDTSTDFSPTYTYPDTGTYVVKLIVNKNSTCPDSITRYVKVYPTFTADFTFSGQPCPDAPITFKDSSYGSVPVVKNWNWSFGDGSTATIPNPVHAYDTGGNYTVVFIAKNTKGCRDTAFKQVYVERFDPFAGNDTIIVKGESINFRGRGGGQYTWTPPTNLSNPNIGNPVGYYPDTGRFTYYVHIVSPNGCEGDDTFTVRVVSQSAIFVPSAFSPNGDGLNDILKPIGIGYRNINFFRVFDRWGEQVFYTTKFNEGWDGSRRGTPADMGVYFWVLSITDRFGKEQLVKGDATLVR